MYSKASMLVKAEMIEIDKGVNGGYIPFLDIMRLKGRSPCSIAASILARMPDSKGGVIGRRHHTSF